MDENELQLKKALSGNADALFDLLSGYRERLRRFVRFRLSHSLKRRVDESDVVQEAFVDIAKRLNEFEPERGLEFYEWVRHLVGLKLNELHRFHLATEARDVRREVHGDQNDENENLAILANQLVDSMTSPTQAVAKQEIHGRILRALESLTETDQEILFLRHFEQMSTQQIADLLGMSKAGAGSRYIRAISRLRDVILPSDSSESSF